LLLLVLLTGSGSTGHDSTMKGKEGEKKLATKKFLDLFS
jgi:hypothetical protein